MKNKGDKLHILLLYPLCGWSWKRRGKNHTGSTGKEIRWYTLWSGIKRRNIENEQNDYPKEKGLQSSCNRRCLMFCVIFSFLFPFNFVLRTKSFVWSWISFRIHPPSPFNIDIQMSTQEWLSFESCRPRDESRTNDLLMSRKWIRRQKNMCKFFVTTKRGRGKDVILVKKEVVKRNTKWTRSNGRRWWRGESNKHKKETKHNELNDTTFHLQVHMFFTWVGITVLCPQNQTVFARLLLVLSLSPPEMLVGLSLINCPSLRIFASNRDPNTESRTWNHSPKERTQNPSVTRIHNWICCKNKCVECMNDNLSADILVTPLLLFVIQESIY